MKLAIVSMAVGDFYNKVAELTVPTLRKYAERIGADFIELQPNEVYRKFPHYLKYELGTVLDNYDSICYIDADIVMGLLNPAKMQLETSLGYNINVEGFPYNLKYKYRLLKIIKNRLGQDNISIGLYTKPEAGYFEELPKAVDMTTEDYTRYLNK
jgi:hypothetical protein